MTTAEPPAFSSAWWLLFSRDHDPAAARAVFTSRFGVAPAFCLPRPNGWWVGPLPDEESTP